MVDSPDRALQEVLPEGVQLAVQARPDGTGGATAAAMEQLGPATPSGLDQAAPVVILSGDVPLVSAAAIGELIEAHRQSGAAATMASTILEDPTGYGRVVRDSVGALERVVETKRQGDSTQAERDIREVNTGIFVFDATALRAALPRLSAENAQAELYLPQVLDVLRSDGAGVAAHVVHDERLVLGVNDRVALARVRRLAQQAIHERHMRAGVGIVDPHATVIDLDVAIGADTVIEPFTTIRGSTRIGSDCTIRHSYLVDCVLEDGATVGPFAYLRPGTVLRKGAKAGTFVEIKASDIGAGAKVPPLLHRRRGGGRADEPGSGDDHGQLRRPRQAPHGRRTPGEDGGRHDARRAGGARRRRLHGRRLGDHRRCAGRRARHRARASDEHRRLRAGWERVVLMTGRRGDVYTA